MRAVHKYPLNLTGESHVHDDANMKLLHVDMQDGAPTLWAEVDTKAVVATRAFRIFGTGHNIPKGWSHVGTCMDGMFVWHVYSYDGTSP